MEIATGRAVPEAVLLPGARLQDQLERLRPDVVILQTARAYRRAVLDGPWRTIIDLVDRLSRSYRQRAALGGRARSLALRGLAASHDRLEQGLAADCRVPVVAAGRGEAEALGATWLPNLVEADPTPDRKAAAAVPPFDAVFFGSLNYPPNIEALRWLASANLAGAGLRLLVAGHRPSPEVYRLAAANAWTVREDYPSVAWLATQARVALAPLSSTAGIQNKVLEAAVFGMPQVVSPDALAGIGDDFPARVAATPTELVRATRALVDDEVAGRQLASEARNHVQARFSVDAWRPTFEALIDPEWSRDDDGPADGHRSADGVGPMPPPVAGRR
jgi:hypothetical protein